MFSGYFVYNNMGKISIHLTLSPSHRKGPCVSIQLFFLKSVRKRTDILDTKIRDTTNGILTIIEYTLHR